MCPRLFRALLVIAVLLAMAGVANAAPAEPAREPAPPPASCRTEPTSSWAALTAPPAVVPDLVPFQDYRTGLALTPDATGTGVRIADVEYEWLASHLDLAAKALPAASPTGLPAGYQARDHGTAVLGVLGGTSDGVGITGIAPDATLLPTSPFISGTYRPRDAIAAAAAGLGPGDVLLIELQASIGGGTMVPIEVYPEVRAEIAKAVARGIVVVEPAANSGADLATITLDASLGANPWAPGTAGEDDSGALIVGGGGSGSPLLNVPTVGDLQRTPESNYGARVNVQGYGAGVVTSGYSDLPLADADSAYTACFDGTSSASATVAGAVAAVQGAAIARFGSPLTPDEVTTLLEETGLPQVGAPGDGSIGPRPQVAAAIDAIASVRGRVPATPPTPQIVPPATTAPVPVAPATGAAAPASVLATPTTATKTAVPVVVPAARLTPLARFERRAARLVISLRRLAPGARVTVNGRRVALRAGTVVLTRVRPRTFVVRVTAPPRAGRTYRPTRFTVTVPARGAARVRTG